ncbi:hypothetical protein RJT34_17705 [Clitoria ternatea]|uniref:Uncharacterized protein n=1 Tax=Clitoria ternatea TaxID=43366 RepID=A0AAN9JBM9_CLITE
MAESGAEGATALLNFQPKFNHKAKLKELLHRITSLEIELCADATEEFKKLLKAEKGGVLLHSLLESPIHLLVLSKAARDVSKFATVALVDVDSKDIQVYIKYFLPVRDVTGASVREKPPGKILPIKTRKQSVVVHPPFLVRHSSSCIASLVSVLQGLGPLPACDVCSRVERG